MDLVRTVLLYMMMLVGTATGASPEITPMPAGALPTPTAYVTPAPTARPTNAPTPSPRPTTYKTLYVGDKGSAVRALQTRLKELGYLTGSVDGNYGQQTKQAVEHFQRNNGLKVDGIAGKNTQQVMFESPNVVYASAATLIPTYPPVTATPARPAVVQVNYVDHNSGLLIATDTVQCYGNTYISANAAKVPASYRLVSNSQVYVSVSNGTASPAVVTFRYQSSATSTPSTGIRVPVYYLDASNLIVAQEARTMYQSGTVTANLSIIPAGYTLSGSSVVYVTVSQGAANPNLVIFRLNRNQTSTPAPATGVVVPVHYINNSTGAIFATQNIQMLRTGNVYPQRSQVPDGYTLISASYVTVTISNGRANPAVVEFRYQPYQPTATPVVSVTVPIQYIDASNRVVATSAVSLRSSQLVYADTSLVPGYTLTSAASVYITVRNGQASPSVATFRVTRTVTPTPSPKPITEVAVPVRYLYGTRLVASQTVYIQAGTTRYVYADDSKYSSSYILSESSSNPVRVIVSASGVASPSIVTFNLVPRATATPVPVFQVPVPVRYQYGTRLVASTTVSLQSGTTTTVYADPTVYGSDYILTGSDSATVRVSASGIASPSSVTFYVAPRATPTPTAVPVYNVPVTVRYIDTSSGRTVHSYQEMCTTGTTTTIYADPQYYRDRYTLQGDNWVLVSVSQTGIASPAVVTFYLIPIATPTPTATAVPIIDVSIPVRYMDGSQLVAGYTEVRPSNTVTIIYADPSVYQDRYTLLGDNYVQVNIDARGNAKPSTVTFYLTPIATPVPSFEVPVQVEYRDGNQLVNSTTYYLKSNQQSTIMAEPAFYIGYYLTSSDRVDVNVTADGVAYPNPVIFYLAPIPVTPTPEPYIPITPTPYAPVTPTPAPSVNTPVPPTYDRFQTLEKFAQAGLPKSYDVYSGPGTKYYRANKGRAQYGGGGSARIYGTDGEWLLIGYGFGNNEYRIGYVRNYTLPSNVSPSQLQEVSYAWLPAVITADAMFTDDPVINAKEIDKVKAGTEVSFLAWSDSRKMWAFVEFTHPKLGPIRCFVRDNKIEIK